MIPWCQWKFSLQPNTCQPKTGNLRTYAGIHFLVEKIGWHRYEGSKEAIKKELKGVLAHGTWDYSEVIARDDLMKRKEPFNIGRLMTILSAKRWESLSVRKLKARIVFRGDDIQDGEGNLAVLLESKVNPAGISAINANLADGSLLNQKTTQPDVVRAHLQSTLCTKVPTFLELPSELVPEERKCVKRPFVRLWKPLRASRKCFLLGSRISWDNEDDGCDSHRQFPLKLLGPKV